MSTMLRFMETRARAILKGEIGHSRVVYAAHQKKHVPECQAVARAQARASPSDPNTYDRVMSHLLNGITLRGDYLVEWAKRRVEGPFAALSKHPLADKGQFGIVVEIPINCKIPTYC